MSFVVVVPSKTVTNLAACVQAIKQNEPTLASERIVCVDDSADGDIRIILYCQSAGITCIRGESPFVFAVNVNAGLRYSFTTFPNVVGAIVVNDDALLESPNGFTAMAHVAQEHQEYGLIGAVTNCVGNPNQFPQNLGLRDEPRMVCMVCVFLPRSTFETVGPLDTRYSKYGMDDDDFSFEVRKAGFKIGVFDGCYLNHNSLPSSFRGPAGAGGDFRYNMELFKKKWGTDNFGRPV